MGHTIQTENRDDILKCVRQGVDVVFARELVFLHTSSGTRSAVRIGYWITLGDMTWLYTEHRMADASGAPDTRTTLLTELLALKRAHPDRFQLRASPTS